MLQKIKKAIPASVKRPLKRLLGRAQVCYYAIFGKRTDFICPVCNKKNIDFQPWPTYYLREMFNHQSIHNLFFIETLNVEHYTCNKCDASDRDRLYALYFNHFLNSNPKKSYNVLDIAPSASLNRSLKRKSALTIRSADMFMEEADDKIDIMDMNGYSDNQFDIFICSHVLEHVDNDIKAMKELYRVLKPGGWGIAMVPISTELQGVYENPEIKDPDLRWKHFLQNDHVRMYSKQGFIKRLEMAGFEVEQNGIEYFGHDTFKVSGVHPRSVLYIVKKAGQ